MFHLEENTNSGSSQPDIQTERKCYNDVNF